MRRACNPLGGFAARTVPRPHSTAADRPSHAGTAPAGCPEHLSACRIGRASVLREQVPAAERDVAGAHDRATSIASARRAPADNVVAINAHIACPTHLGARPAIEPLCLLTGLVRGERGRAGRRTSQRRGSRREGCPPRRVEAWVAPIKGKDSAWALVWVPVAASGLAGASAGHRWAC